MPSCDDGWCDTPGPVSPVDGGVDSVVVVAAGEDPECSSIIVFFKYFEKHEKLCVLFFVYAPIVGGGQDGRQGLGPRRTRQDLVLQLAELVLQAGEC